MLALDRVDWALTVSLVSVVVAASSLSWQIFAALRIDRARVIVDVAHNLNMTTPPAGRALEIVVVTATNRGRRPATVTFLALVLLPHSPWYKLITRAQRRRRDGGLLVPMYDDVEIPNPVLPKRLDVGDAVQILYRRDHVERHAKERDAFKSYGMANTTAGVVHSRPRRLRPATLHSTTSPTVHE